MRALLLLLAILISCTTPSQNPSAPASTRVIRVHNMAGARSTVGNSAIVGDNLVITAHHVAFEGDESRILLTSENKRVHISWYGASVIDNVENLLNQEPISIIKLRSGSFKGLGSYHLGLGMPTKVETHRGTFQWNTYRPKPGDSGSPILNNKGEIVGLVWGHDGLGRPIMLRVTPSLWRKIKTIRGE